MQGHSDHDLLAAWTEVWRRIQGAAHEHQFPADGRARLDRGLATHHHERALDGRAGREPHVTERHRQVAADVPLDEDVAEDDDEVPEGVALADDLVLAEAEPRVVPDAVARVLRRGEHRDAFLARLWRRCRRAAGASVAAAGRPASVVRQAAPAAGSGAAAVAGWAVVAAAGLAAAASGVWASAAGPHAQIAHINASRISRVMTGMPLQGPRGSTPPNTTRTRCTTPP